MSAEKPSIKKRFIAGAVCPRCSDMDSIVVYKIKNAHHRECVSCDFKEVTQFGDDNGRPKAELETRVNTPIVNAQAQIHDHEQQKNAPQVVKILGADENQ
ncbi:YheV family putative zinc ribbon protein [Aurantivibrio plasticivorans]